VSAENTTRPRPETARVFFALWPPTDIARQLAGVAVDFSKQAGGRPTRRETIHLTLAFLGDVAVERLPELQRVAGEVRASAFDLTLDHFGLWHHKRIFWAGCSVVPPALVELASALRTALQAAEFDVADARRNFFPHVTLVRKVMAPGTQLPNHAPLSWPCAHFVLVSSSLSAKRAAYRMIAEYPLITAALSLGEL